MPAQGIAGASQGGIAIRDNPDLARAIDRIMADRVLAASRTGRAPNTSDAERNRIALVLQSGALGRGQPAAEFFRYAPDPDLMPEVYARTGRVPIGPGGLPVGSATVGAYTAPETGALLSNLRSQGVTDDSGGSSKASGQADVLTPMVTTLTGHLLEQRSSAPAITPTQASALSHLHHQQAQAPTRQHQAQVGRAEVARVTAAVLPELRQIKERLRARATQIAATAEHRTIEERNQFRTNVRTALARIEALITRAVAPRRY